MKEKTYLVIFPQTDGVEEVIGHWTKEQIKKEIEFFNGCQSGFMVIDGKMLKKCNEKIDIEKL